VKATFVVLVLALATAPLGGCSAIHRQEAKGEENLLSAAGFAIKPADSPKRAAELATMPPLKMVRRIKDGRLVFTYADPYRCKCLYTGNEAAFDEYKRLQAQRNVAADQMIAANEAEMASIDWDMWGPWGW